MNRIVVAAVLSSVALVAGDFHPGKSLLTKEEQSPVGVLQEKTEGFSILWKSPDLKGWHLLKWDADHSAAVPDAPSDLLDRIHEEVSRINQKPGEGEDLFLSVNVYKFKKQGFLTNPVAFFEVVARDKAGKMMWAAIDKVKSTQELAQSLADTDAQIVGREILKRIRVDFTR